MVVATLVRDAERYENVCERNKNNGKKGGRPPKNDEKFNIGNPEENPVGYLETQRKRLKPKKADIDIDRVIDREKDIDIDIDIDIDKDRNIIINSTSSFSAKKVYSDEFSQLWSLYPKKIGKGGAYKVFEKMKLTNEDLVDIKNALKWQKQSEQWQKNNGQFIRIRLHIFLRDVGKMNRLKH